MDIKTKYGRITTGTDIKRTVEANELRIDNITHWSQYNLIEFIKFLQYNHPKLLDTLLRDYFEMLRGN